MNFPNIDNVVFSIGKVQMGNYIPLGTCFSLSNPGLFATAAHVLDGSDKDIFIRINTQFINGYQDIQTSEHHCLPVKIVHYDPLRDTCVFSVEVQISPNIVVSNTDNLNPGETVTVFGFPHSNLNRIVLTQQTCEVGAKIYLDSNGIKSKHIVLNIQSRPGQSGGPIIRNSDGSLVGILIGSYVPNISGGISLGGIDPQTLHQTTHAVSTEYLGEMIK